MVKFNELPIREEIKRAAQEMGYEDATEIQSQAIPLILDGKDVLGKSHTGTGKTAAFGIPAIEKIEENQKNPAVLMICPTRELVTQVAMELRKFSKYLEGVKIVPIYGGQPIDRQIQLMKRGSNIIVGTPGRIMDHLRRKTLKTAEIKMVVLDEADEMLNMGFKEDIESILGSLPRDNKVQTVLFSATWPKTILAITKAFQHDPIQVEVNSKQRTIDSVKQFYYDVPRGKKVNALRVLLHHYNPNRCMIFANTKRQVDELANELKKVGIQALSIHGDMKQDVRMRVMEQFRTHVYPVMIASDVAARGIDIDDIDLVVNFDIPQDNEYYIHRVGRTGRAGKDGMAITLISGARQKTTMKQIISYTKTAIHAQNLPTSEQSAEKSREQFITQVKNACNESLDDESFRMANELMAEGIALETLIYGLIHMSYAHEKIDIEDEKMKSYAKNYDAITLRLNVGREQGVQPGNIVAAILEETGIASKAIGKIDVQKGRSFVSIDAAYIDTVIAKMHGASVKGNPVQVEIDTPPKRTKRNSERGGNRGGGFQKSNRNRDGERPQRRNDGNKKYSKNKR